MTLPIYISGPHGSGKTTLINKIKNEEIFIENDFDINFLKQFPSMAIMNAYECCLLRLYHRIYTAIYASQKVEKANSFAKCKSSEFLLVSRSIYDSLVYSQTEYSLGQMSKDEYNTLNTIAMNALQYINPYVIILNPSIDTILARLEKRKRFNERVEREKLCAREDTYEYVKKVHEAFLKYKDNDNVLYLTDNDDDSIQQIVKWIEKLI
ncbi:MAG: deoxynucleoside kinase [Acetobacter sp.]|nr:deoxynucleoside kinase [Bacteroides sp.]MCM1340788.1 deoxynucleoside kinase [Acetobacter sp.]MCM1432655.1 deoxynucleoside kinase [Clostridiales bacterium]